MAEKQIKKGKNQPLLYIHHLDLYKLQRHMQQSVIVKQIEQTAETQENEIDHVETSEQTHYIVEEISVADQQNMQTDVMEIGVVNQHNVQTDVTEIDAVDQHNTHASVAEENQPKQNDEQFVESLSSTKHNKSFKDMNNEEKIYFLLSRPHYIPSVKCVVKTEEASYVGVVTSYENGVLQMVVPGYISNFFLNIEDVISIRMMGL
ncbi:CotO family spore coat protein [Bacillus cereus group sp. BfR-BA-01380]|uniref:CotO family spore coat protein n=1 Tax=Bacillus cereus group sp. BfR-BA-01380 TaxID=2920324 RepID=UPI001F55C9F4|nr:CotO family spore coat protein [Bacillus cereus group sp. BfR-BA-01380]